MRQVWVQPPSTGHLRDIRERIEMFMGGTDIDRLALNWEQIELYDPPPNFAKTTDARFKSYERQFGTDSWELDALEPAVIENLIEDNILKWRDDYLWEEKEQEEEYNRKLLFRTHGNWEEIEKLLNNGRG